MLDFKSLTGLQFNRRQIEMALLMLKVADPWSMTMIYLILEKQESRMNGSKSPNNGLISTRICSNMKFVQNMTVYTRQLIQLSN